MCHNATTDPARAQAHCAAPATSRGVEGQGPSHDVLVSAQSPSVRPWTHPAFRCEYYAVKRGLTLTLSGGESGTFLLQLMGSLKATREVLREHEAITRDDAGYLYVKTFANKVSDRAQAHTLMLTYPQLLVLADEEDRQGRRPRNS
jgi:hypothetical protein